MKQKGKEKLRKNRSKKNIFPLQVPMYIGPISVWVVLFVIIPLIIILYFSFLKMGPYGKITHAITFDNYYGIFKAGYGKIFAQSFLFSFITNILCILIGYPLAYFIAKYGGKAKPFLMFFIVIPSWTAYLIRLYAFKIITGQTGLLNSLLLKLGIISTPLNILYTPLAVILGLVYTWIPFMILPLFASLEGLDPSLIEAGMDLGAKPFIRFFKIILPLTKGGLIAGTILVFIPSLGDWLVPHLLGGAKVMMIGSLVAYKFTQVGDIAGGASLAIILAATIVLALYMSIKLGGEEALEKLI
jgi:spermidine/putrescine transport system permease protein